MYTRARHGLEGETMTSSGEEDGLNEQEMTPAEAHEWMQVHANVPFIGGPKDGEIDENVQVFKPPFDRVFFINRQMCHYYYLDGDTDKGFWFTYHGIREYKCNGDATYTVDAKKEIK
jgi:hypothetical protein